MRVKMTVLRHIAADAQMRDEVAAAGLRARLTVRAKQETSDERTARLEREFKLAVMQRNARRNAGEVVERMVY